MDKQILNDQITSLEAALGELRKTRDTHIKANALAEQIEKARVELDGHEAELEKVKEKKKELRAKREELLRSVCKPLAKAVTEFLPLGRAVVEMTDRLFMGWEGSQEGAGDRITPYASLSGGEKAIFDAALSHALLKGPGHKVIVLEAAEVDSRHLADAFERITQIAPEAQIVVNTWDKQLIDELEASEKFDCSQWSLVRL